MKTSHFGICKGLKFNQEAKYMNYKGSVLQYTLYGTLFKKRNIVTQTAIVHKSKGSLLFSYVKASKFFTIGCYHLLSTVIVLILWFSLEDWVMIHF